MTNADADPVDPRAPKPRSGARRILVVAQVDPWQETFGATLRLRSVIDALERLGSVDIVTLPRPRHDAADDADHRGRLGRTLDGGGRGRALVQALIHGVPRSTAVRVDVSPVERLTRMARATDYDLAWISREYTFHAVRSAGVTFPSMVVDLDDLQDRVRAQRSGDPTSAVRRILWRLDDRLWQSSRRRVVAQADRVLVCTETDAERVAGATVLQNPYAVPNDMPDTDLAFAERPLEVLFAGRFSYRPNVEALRELIGDVWPLVLRRLPEARLTVVGRQAEEAAGHLGQLDGVRFEGQVPSMAPYLHRARAVVAPIRLGSGSNLKVLEGFACSRTVVATPFAMRGIDDPDRYALVREEPTALAEGLLSALADEHLARREEAHAYWRRRHSPDAFRRRTAEIVDGLL